VSTRSEVEWTRAEYADTSYFVASYRHPDAPAPAPAPAAEASKVKSWPNCWMFRCCGSPA